MPPKTDHQAPQRRQRGENDEQSPLDKVVFIQKVAAFIHKTDSLKGLFRLAYVNNSWNDTIKNYAFHLFEERTLDIESTKALEAVCGRVIECGVLWFADVLLSSKTLLNRVNSPRLVCENASSLEVMKFGFEKILEVGGKNLLKSQLTVADNLGHTCLMHICLRSSTSPDVLKLILKFVIEKINEAGGPDLVKSQLSAINNSGATCLMFACRNFSSPEVMKVVFEKIDEVGGKDLLKSQLTATDRSGYNCLMFGCRFFNSSPDVPKLVFEKILEAGGTDFLSAQLAATSDDGATCLMVACRYSSSPEVVKLLLEKIDEVGGPELLKSQLTATTRDGWNCLKFACASVSLEVMKLVLEKIVEAAGTDVLSAQLAVTNSLRLSFHWMSDSQENVMFIAVVLFELNLFKQQYAELDYRTKEILREQTVIKDASWVPYRVSIAEVKKMLKRD